MRRNKVELETLQEWENEMIRFVYRMFWNQEWKGHSIPPHVYKSFVTNVGKLSEMFTRERKNLQSNYFQKKEARSAYLLYFHLANFVRVRAVLEDVRANLNGARNLRVLDIGSGMASSIWALADVFGDQVSEVVISDQNKNVLSEARSLWGRMVEHQNFPNYTLKTSVMDLGDQRTPSLLNRLGTFDIVIAANVLNEVLDLPERARQNFFKHTIEKSLSPKGMLVLVEPALQKTSRNLMALRDELSKKFSLYTPLPCFHSQVCPLNSEVRDWCHFDIHWKPPHLRKRFEKTMDHNSGILKYSYVAFSKEDYRPQSKVHRVISDELKLREGKTILLCTPEGKVRLPIDTKKKVWFRGAEFKEL